MAIRKRTIVGAVVLFAAGAATVQVAHEVDTVAKGLVTVYGTVEFSDGGSAALDRPPARGHFVRSGTLGRVYLSHPDLDRYLGRYIRGSGPVLTTCGREGTPCHPLVRIGVGGFEEIDPRTGEPVPQPGPVGAGEAPPPPRPTHYP